VSVPDFDPSIFCPFDDLIGDTLLGPLSWLDAPVVIFALGFFLFFLDILRRC